MLRRSILAAAAALAAAGGALAQQPAQQPLFLFMYKPGPAWQAGKPMNQQALRPHAQYIQRLTNEGKVVAGGPTLDVDGGMAVVRAKDSAEAKAILAADPAITAGVFTAEVRVWMPLIDSGKPLRP